LAPKLNVLSLFGFAVVDQAMLSSANFLLAFLLIRYTSGTDYGLFVIATSTILLLITAQGSLVSGPLSLLAPRKSPEERREMIGAIEADQRRIMGWVVIAALTVPPVGYMFGAWSGIATAVSLVTIIASWTSLSREFSRTVLLIYSRSRDLLTVDAMYVAMLIAGALIAIAAPTRLGIFGRSIPLSTAVWAVVALAIAGRIGGRISYRMLSKAPGWSASSSSARFWREMRPLGFWSAIGAGIFWLFTQSYNYIIASQIGLEAVADVNATRILLMPAILITVGVRALLIPNAAAWLVEFGIGKLVRRLAASVIGIGVLDLIYFAFLWFFRHWITVDLMHRTIGDLDRLLVLWGCVALLGLGRDILQTALQALHRLKIVAALTGVAAVVSIAIMWFGLSHWGAAATLIGQIAGETLILIGTVLLILQSHRRARVRSVAAATQPHVLPQK
jgi:O-antigen/teichoic acid export membrane protein